MKIKHWIDVYMIMILCYALGLMISIAAVGSEHFLDIWVFYSLVWIIVTAVMWGLFLLSPKLSEWIEKSLEDEKEEGEN
jgi:membrane protein YdbS with pleckstrin-like domain